MKNILIVGYGFVGKATEYLLQHTGWKIHIYDPALKKLAEIKTYDYIFLCVPTNLNSETKKLDLSILKEVYLQWRDYGEIVIRSTIGPDQIDDFPSASVMPEFLREKHWKEDVVDPLLPIIVSDSVLANDLIECIDFKVTYLIKAKEAMMYKLARNSALAMKTALANEYREICETYQINYNTIESLLTSDLNVGGTHWVSPGPDGKVGFGGKCLPKDLTHMSTLCNNNINIMQEALKINLIRRETND